MRHQSLLQQQRYACVRKCCFVANLIGSTTRATTQTATLVVKCTLCTCHPLQQNTLTPPKRREPYKTRYFDVQPGHDPPSLRRGYIYEPCSTPEASSSQQPLPASASNNRGQRRGGTGRFMKNQCRFYAYDLELKGLKSHDEAAIQDGLLQQLGRAWSGPRTLLTPLWGPILADSAQRPLATALTQLLDSLAAVLHVRQAAPSGICPHLMTPGGRYNHQVFQRPLCSLTPGSGEGPGSSGKQKRKQKRKPMDDHARAFLCMEWGPAALPTHMSGVEGNYLNLTLAVAGKDAHGHELAEVKEKAHRLVAWAVRGPPPEGTEVMHLCHNKSCLCPCHLQWGTHAENTRAHYNCAHDAAA